MRTSNCFATDTQITPHPCPKCHDASTKQLHKPGFIALFIDALPSSWLSFCESWPIGTERVHCTDFLYELHSCTRCLHDPRPLPSGGTSPGGRGKRLSANLKQCEKPGVFALFIDAPPYPWLSLRESCPVGTERAHSTDSTHRPPLLPGAADKWLPL